MKAFITGNMDIKELYKGTCPFKAFCKFLMMTICKGACQAFTKEGYPRAE